MYVRANRRPPTIFHASSTRTLVRSAARALHGHQMSLEKAPLREKATTALAPPTDFRGVERREATADGLRTVPASTGGSPRVLTSKAGKLGLGAPLGVHGRHTSTPVSIDE